MKTAGFSRRPRRHFLARNFLHIALFYALFEFQAAFRAFAGSAGRAGAAQPQSRPQSLSLPPSAAKPPPPPPAFLGLAPPGARCLRHARGRRRRRRRRRPARAAAWPLRSCTRRGRGLRARRTPARSAEQRLANARRPRTTARARAERRDALLEVGLLRELAPLGEREQRAAARRAALELSSGKRSSRAARISSACASGGAATGAIASSLRARGERRASLLERGAALRRKRGGGRGAAGVGCAGVGRAGVGRAAAGAPAGADDTEPVSAARASRRPPRPPPPSRPRSLPASTRSAAAPARGRPCRPSPARHRTARSAGASGSRATSLASAPRASDRRRRASSARCCAHVAMRRAEHRLELRDHTPRAAARAPCRPLRDRRRRRAVAGRRRRPQPTRLRPTRRRRRRLGAAHAREDVHEDEVRPVVLCLNGCARERAARAAVLDGLRSPSASRRARQLLVVLLPAALARADDEREPHHLVEPSGAPNARAIGRRWRAGPPRSNCSEAVAAAQRLGEARASSEKAAMERDELEVVSLNETQVSGAGSSLWPLPTKSKPPPPSMISDTGITSTTTMMMASAARSCTLAGSNKGRGAVALLVVGADGRIERLSTSARSRPPTRRSRRRARGRACAARRAPCPRALLMPGFVDGHAHAPQWSRSRAR